MKTWRINVPSAPQFTAVILFLTAAAGGAQDTLVFADNLVYNDFYALTIHSADGESFTLFNAASFEGDAPPWPNAQGSYGDTTASGPEEGMKYFFWIRRTGPAGAVTHPLPFSRITEIDFTGPHGGSVEHEALEGLLTLNGEELNVRVRVDEGRISGWAGPSPPPVPFHRPVRLRLTDGSEQSAYIKSDGFIGGIDEEFGTYAMLWIQHDGIDRVEFHHDGTYSLCPECGAIFYDDRGTICPFDKTPLVSSR